MRLVIIVISFLFLFGCDSSVCREENLIDQQPISIEVERLEEELFSFENEVQIKSFLDNHPSFTRVFLDGDQYPTNDVLAKKLFGLTNDPFIDTLYQETVDIYEDFDGIEEDIVGIFGRLKTLYPSLKTPKVQTAITGLYGDLFISDSLIIIGLDYFVGKGASYPPMNIPGYILRRYDRAHLPGILAKFMAGSLIDAGRKETMLSEMIDFGKTYYLTSRLLPCTPDSLLIGYTSKEMDLITENETIIWANFIENEVLYETSHIMKQKFLGERPNVYEISQECPGRIGAWVGWQIVNSYMENNDVSIIELLSDMDNEKIFSKSGYKPKG